MKALQLRGLLVGIVLGVSMAGLAPLLRAQSSTSQPVNPAARSPQQRRLDAAAKVIDTIEKRNPRKIEDPELWHTWQLRWMESAKAMAPDAKARVQIHTEFRDRMKNFLAQAEKGRDYYGSHEITIADYYLAEAEAWLAQEGR